MPVMILPCSGPYLGTLNALSLGMQNDDGFQLRLNVHGQEMNATDQFGKTLLEGIYQGEDWRVRFTGIEWGAGLLAAMQMFGQVGQAETLAPTLSGTYQGAGGFTRSIVGDRMSRYYSTLLLTAILGNPPTTPQSLTASYAGLAPEMQTEFMMTSKARELPLELCLLPYQSTKGSSNFVIPFSTL